MVAGPSDITMHACRDLSSCMPASCHVRAIALLLRADDMPRGKLTGDSCKHGKLPACGVVKLQDCMSRRLRFSACLEVGVEGWRVPDPTRCNCLGTCTAVGSCCCMRAATVSRSTRWAAKGLKQPSAACLAAAAAASGEAEAGVGLLSCCSAVVHR